MADAAWAAQKNHRRWYVRRDNHRIMARTARHANGLKSSFICGFLRNRDHLGIKVYRWLRVIDVSFYGEAARICNGMSFVEDILNSEIADDVVRVTHVETAQRDAWNNIYSARLNRYLAN